MICYCEVVRQCAAFAKLHLSDTILVIPGWHSRYTDYVSNRGFDSWRVQDIFIFFQSVQTGIGGHVASLLSGYWIRFLLGKAAGP